MFRTHVAEAFNNQFANTEAVSATAMLEAINGSLAPQHAFGPAEGDRILQVMGDQEDILYSDAMVYRL